MSSSALSDDFGVSVCFIDNIFMTTIKRLPIKSEAAGCHITTDDTSTVLESVTCSATYFVYGACFSSLGAALPELADKLSKATPDFRIAFTTRGAGYLIGTLLSAFIIKRLEMNITKTVFACVFLILTGVPMFVIAESRNFTSMMVLFGIQGVGFGGIDMMVSC